MSKSDVGDTIMAAAGIVTGLFIALHSGTEDFLIGTAPFVFLDCAISSIFIMKHAIFNIIKEVRRNGRN